MAGMNGLNGHGEEEDAFEQFFDEGLTDLERRRALEIAGRVAADIEIDLQEKGPLYLYVQARRDQARDALRALVSVDPKDAVSVVRMQTTVAEYLKVFDWIRGCMDEAENAEAIIKEDYSKND